MKHQKIPLFIVGAVMCSLAMVSYGNPGPYKPKKNIYHKGWIDFNKNGKKDVYEDPAQPVSSRVADLLNQMTLEEKSCQLATYYGYKKMPYRQCPDSAMADNDSQGRYS